MGVKMTERLRKHLREIALERYQQEGQHYYRMIKRNRLNREGTKEEESKKMLDFILEVLEERRAEGIVDYGYEDD